MGSALWDRNTIAEQLEAPQSGRESAPEQVMASHLMTVSGALSPSIRPVRKAGSVSVKPPSQISVARALARAIVPIGFVFAGAAVVDEKRETMAWACAGMRVPIRAQR